ncbi:MAG: PstS family phosphate ABC transporter substrate-binding protein [Fimbriimonadaceae bacterium]|nr:PstS family phosphate ABC transporter substrate-binding protein [Fimbriimonadaceae bacterium]
MKRFWCAGLLAAVILSGCSKPADEAPTPAPTPEGGAPVAAEPGAPAATDLSGAINVSGSSTVMPISEAVAEEFMKGNPNVKVTVGEAGTGGGMKKFGAGEIEVTGASRPIKDKEIEACQTASIDFVELPVAYDGLAVVVHPQNDWVDHLTVAELKKIWEPSSKVKTWKDVRASFPAEPVKLFGPGTDSGTFDYFTDEICGKEGASRTDYTASEDDNTLVQGVAGSKGGLGYFGFSYYVNNKDKLKVVPVQAEGGQPVEPSETTVRDGSYKPLSRPLFIYVSAKALERPEVAAFAKFYVEQSATLAAQVGYVGLPAEIVTKVGERLSAKTTGSTFSGHKGSLADGLAATPAAAPAAPAGEKGK